MHRVNFALFLIFSFYTYDFVFYDFVNLFPQFPSHQYTCTPKLQLPKLNFCDLVIINAISILIIQLLFSSLLYYSNTTRYIRFSKNLSLLSRKTIQYPISLPPFSHLLHLIILIDTFESLFILIPIMCEMEIFHINRLYAFHILSSFIYRCRTICLVYNTTFKFSLKIIHYLRLLSSLGNKNSCFYVVLIIASKRE